MQVVAINGSPHKNGNTYLALKMVTDELEQAGIATKILHIGDKAIRGCLGCGQCYKQKNGRCVQEGDGANECIQAMREADGILLGSPVHYANIGGTMKAFLDRAFYVSSANDGMFRHKVGAGVVAVRRAGGIPAFHQLNTYFTYAEMLIPSSNYWNSIHGTRPGEAEQDEEGRQILRVLAKNMAWLMRLVEHGKATIPPPEAEPKVYMNFIR
ncbi:MAG: flavodoxin family protein [Desulfobulbus sp.]|jgi:multimeric flavodoxin WrbA